MQISFVRTGGFAGLRQTAQVDVTTLPPDQARQVRAWLAAADFFHLPQTLTAPHPQPDRFQYQITIETDTERHTVRTSEETMPKSLRPLVDWLTAQTRPYRPQ
ncbi:protealysin inhibitor emfourin [Anthocerotibacter panamensis]|uniref:protealysin inhibitor emfourin n=1 Tax=Anthocerotibacter panamensis TaxID=2857077 RepID=UPI001C40474D|nr:protealysin inhibitor emfourin [Anthocerotibacter panamensis]